jgi:hypothetical protein
MLQHACGPNRDKLPLIDMKPESIPNHPRPRPGDPPLPPQRIVVDYQHGVALLEHHASQHMLSKYAGRSALDQILGPTAGKIERLSQVTGAAASMDWKASDTHALRQLFFMQNLVYLRQLFDQVDAGAHPPGH